MGAADPGPDGAVAAANDYFENLARGDFRANYNDSTAAECTDVVTPSEYIFDMTVAVDAIQRLLGTIRKRRGRHRVGREDRRGR